MEKNDLDPIVLDGIEVDYNMYLFGEGQTQAFYVGPLIVQDPYYKCLDTSSGKLVMGLEDAGNSAVLRW